LFSIRVSLPLPATVTFEKMAALVPDDVPAWRMVKPENVTFPASVWMLTWPTKGSAAFPPSMMVVAAPAPRIESALVTRTCSLYVPAHTWIVSPFEAAATAAEIVG
jgi:hypothetical protein